MPFHHADLAAGELFLQKKRTLFLRHNEVPSAADCLVPFLLIGIECIPNSAIMDLK